jgi:hypothetical protein
MIDDDDYDTDYPEPVDDQNITSYSVLHGDRSTPLLATIHVVRSVQPMVKLFRSPTITLEALQSFDKHLNACINLFPPSLHPSSLEPLRPRSIAPMIYLQNARLVLHRHNLSPLCPPGARSHAIDMCVSIARDTTRLVARCVGGHPTSDSRSDLAMSASTLLCTHLWRCVLFLLFAGDYASSLVLVQTLAIIGSARVVTDACGRNISFFLKCIFERLQNGVVGPFEHDEELMVYVSGDMQSRTDSSWIWHGSETGADLTRISDEAEDYRPPEGVERSLWPPFPCAEVDRKTYEIRTQDDEAKDWPGWEHLEKSIEYFLRQQHQQHQEKVQLPQKSDRLPDIRTIGISRTEESVTQGAQTASNQPRLQESPSSYRMNISHII